MLREKIKRVFANILIILIKLIKSKNCSNKKYLLFKKCLVFLTNLYSILFKG